MERNPVDVFFHKSQVDILLVVGNTNITEITRETRLTYSYVSKRIREFKELGLVNIEKRGSMVLVRLTDEGRELATAFENVVDKLERLEWKK